MEFERQYTTAESIQNPSCLGDEKRVEVKTLGEGTGGTEEEYIVSVAEVIAVGLIGTTVFINFGSTISLGRSFFWPIYGQIPIKSWLYFLIWTVLIIPFAYCGGKNGRFKKHLLIIAGMLLLIDLLLILYNVLIH